MTFTNHGRTTTRHQDNINIPVSSSHASGRAINTTDNQITQRNHTTSISADPLGTDYAHTAQEAQRSDEVTRPCMNQQAHSSHSGVSIPISASNVSYYADQHFDVPRSSQSQTSHINDDSHPQDRSEHSTTVLPSSHATASRQLPNNTSIADPQKQATTPTFIDNPSQEQDDLDQESQLPDSSSGGDPSSLSASFLLELDKDPRTPTARYSFDDHQDYFHRLEWEALVDKETSSSPPIGRPSTNMAFNSPPPEAADGSSLSNRRSSSSTVRADASPSRPNLSYLDPKGEAPKANTTRRRSNSADGTALTHGSFRNGRYNTRPRHAHPGPPSPSNILLQMRRPQACESHQHAQPSRGRSDSRGSDHMGWSQRANLSMFAEPGIPGTSFPHPAVLASANTGQAAQTRPSIDASSAEFENTIQPWDSPRMPRRALTMASMHEAMRTNRASDDTAVASVPMPIPIGASGRAATSHSIDASELPSAASQRHQTLRSQTHGDPHSLHQSALGGDGGEEDDEQDPDSDKESKQKPALKQRFVAAFKSIRLSSNYFALYKAADRTDIILLVIGTIAAIGSGVPLPLIGILFGQLIDGFNSSGCGGSSAPTNKALFLSSVNDKVEKIAIIAAVNFFLIWTYTTCWSNLGERLVRKMRQRYLRAVLRQDMAFFDTLKPGEVGTRLSADLLTIQNGTSEKMGILISSLSYFVTSYIVAFIKLPKLAGQLVSLLPAFAIVSVFGSRFVAKAQKKTSTHLSHASSLAAEALNNLPVVQAFGSQPRLSNIYQSHLELARKQGTLKALAAACVLGSLFFVGYSANALAFFSGSNLIASSGNPSTVGSVYTVIFLLLDASFIVGQIAPYLQTFSAASGAGQALRETIDKASPIDGTDSTIGLTPQPGDVNEIAVELDNVEFTYPARPDEKALQGLSISVPAGHRVALVGLSGSGKSTVASLLQRFYDPNEGRVTLNGKNLKDYNVRWLRSQIGVVGQEPVLFDCSILQSIAHGLVGSPAHSHLHSTVLAFSQVGQEKTGTDLNQVLTAPEQLSQLQEIQSLCTRAAKLAGAHDFIEKLPQGYDTQVGEAGGKLSGGQKQRISIARAIVKQPKLLILDEATAALDSHSEHAVAKALDSISKGVTTIAIAHRLATIRNYDQIVVMGAGKVLEKGTHKDLLALRGYYYKLAAAQDTGAGEEDLRGENGSADEDDEQVDEDVAEEQKERRRRHRHRMDEVAEGDESEDQVISDDTESPSRDSNQSTLHRRSSEHASASKTGDVSSDDDGGNLDEQSTEREQTDKQLEQAAKKYPPRVILKRVIWMLRREWPYILLGLFTSTIMGGSYSGEAVLFGHVIEALNPQCHSPSGVRSSGREFGLYFFILALIQLFAYTINGLVWGLVAERLLFRLRRVSFDTMMDQRLTWYEAQDQNPASMIASLSNDANNLGGVTGTVIGTIFCIFVNLIAGISVSLAIAWRIAIVILALVPIILAAGYLRLKVLADFQKRHETAYVKSNSLAIEAVQCIKTVASLGREEDVLRKFERSLEKPYRESMRHFLFGNVFLALALSISYFIYAFAYWWGSQNIAEARYGQTAFFIVLPALLFSAQASGQLLAFAPDFSKAHVSAANFFRLMDQRPSVVERRKLLDREKKELKEQKQANRTTMFNRKAKQTAVNINEAKVTDEESAPVLAKKGSADGVEKTQPSTVVFDQVSFTYPTRKEPALKNVSLRIPAGSFAAFVGESGSGKTTAMSLIENFYTPCSGTVSVDGLRTDKTSDQVLRRDIAIVPQEPVIFYGTVRFNVLLGLRPDLHQPLHHNSGSSPKKTLGRRGKHSRLSILEQEQLEDEEALLAPYKEDTTWQTTIPDSVVQEACMAAGIHDTIMGFKKGYDTLISSSQLSGGQKQRLSIARALIRKPRLLLLDESTSALDSQSEQAFQQTLSTIREGGECTILAIAHRMRTIKDADVVFLFGNGELEAKGGYSQLIKQSEKFKAMVSYQSLN
ncbi:related to multidrug resistance protein 4 [Melanopsichium pennsylvanicum]|uniref:Related to multidrug resistance protein 4 n=2 Tax=Melanopsichium pennsylvanicum TaxID=63383 RepID=A0AAJ4XL52_9BASI|nr:related to multidrug resistance protein 4 [Melanopsichium pennsylvanicum 4]SNX84804.1 related to multidrug resistance protein 4 [Melanopsichium pennsylvanicum]